MLSIRIPPAPVRSRQRVAPRGRQPTQSPQPAQYSQPTHTVHTHIESIVSRTFFVLFSFSACIVCTICYTIHMKTQTLLQWGVQWLTDGQPDDEQDTISLSEFPKPQEIIKALNTISAEPFTIENCSIYCEYGHWYVDYDDGYSVSLAL